MTPVGFVLECKRRGIVLSLRQPSTLGELPRIHYRARGKMPPNVLETIRAHKTAIIAALETEIGVWHLADGRKLYRHGDTDWRYVPPDADPADFIENFPVGYQIPRQWRKRRIIKTQQSCNKAI